MKGIYQKKRFEFSRFLPDAAAGSVVFLAALPVFLGIGFVTEAPPLAGIISGIIGGIIVAALGGTRLGISGPSVGLTIAMFAAMSELGYGAFLLVIFISGLLQLLFAYFRWGKWADRMPKSVLHGMMASIGIILAVKQLPNFVGMDTEEPYHFHFYIYDKSAFLAELQQIGQEIQAGALLIGVLSLLMIWAWQRPFIARTSLGKWPVYLMVMVAGLGINQLFAIFFPTLQLRGDFLIHLPNFFDDGTVTDALHFPDFSQWKNPFIYLMALVLALASSLKSLSLAEATNQMSPDCPTTPYNRELRAQGLANSLTGLIGGVPISQLIILSAANIHTGGKTRLASILHSLALFVCILFFPDALRPYPAGFTGRCHAGTWVQAGQPEGLSGSVSRRPPGIYPLCGYRTGDPLDQSLTRTVNQHFRRRITEHQCSFPPNRQRPGGAASGPE